MVEQRKTAALKKKKKKLSKTHNLSLPREHDTLYMSSDEIVLPRFSSSVCCCSDNFVIQITVSVVRCPLAKLTESGELGLCVCGQANGWLSGFT